MCESNVGSIKIYNTASGNQVDKVAGRDGFIKGGSCWALESIQNKIVGWFPARITDTSVELATILWISEVTIRCAFEIRLRLMSRPLRRN